MENDFLNLTKLRTSCRQYRNAAIPREVLEYCLEAARWAPSACNKQPWRFIVVDDPGLRAQIGAKALLPGIPMPWVAQAPVVVVLCARKTIFTHWLVPMLSGIKYHLLDLGIAGEHLVLAAAERGLGSCWIGWFSARKVKKILNLPFNYEPVALLTLGYPAIPGEPSSRLSLAQIREYNHVPAEQE